MSAVFPFRPPSPPNRLAEAGMMAQIAQAARLAIATVTSRAAAGKQRVFPRIGSVGACCANERRHPTDQKPPQVLITIFEMRTEPLLAAAGVFSGVRPSQAAN
jgi:hypothetical protein